MKNNNIYSSILSTIDKENTWFRMTFSFQIIPSNKFVYENDILLFVSFKKIIIYIIFAILLASLKNINIIC